MHTNTTLRDVTVERGGEGMTGDLFKYVGVRRARERGAASHVRPFPAVDLPHCLPARVRWDPPSPITSSDARQVPRFILVDVVIISVNGFTVTWRPFSSVCYVQQLPCSPCFDLSC